MNEISPKKVKIEIEIEIPKELLQNAVEKGFTEESFINFLQELMKEVAEYWLSKAIEACIALEQGLATYENIVHLVFTEGFEIGSRLAQKHVKKEEKEIEEAREEFYRRLQHIRDKRFPGKTPPPSNQENDA